MQSACEKMYRGATVMGDFIIALLAFVAVLLPLLAFMRMRERQRRRWS
jgi:heme/copper-type cytochrome/quinol oxidase subunit 4